MYREYVNKFIRKILDSHLYCLYTVFQVDAGWSSLVARRAHNPKVVGSNPAPATNFILITPFMGFFII